MIIDTHTHAFSEKIAGRAMAKLSEVSDIKPLTDGTVSGLLKRMDESGIDKSVVLPIATKPTQERVINSWASNISSEKILAFGSIHPDSDDVYAAAEGIKKSGLYGVKLHPDYQGFLADDTRAYPIYDACQELSLPVVIHAGFDPLSPDHIHALPHMLENVHRDFPRLKLILAHLGGMYRWDGVERHIAGCDGEVYLDTAVIAGEIGRELLERIISRHGTDRILFASDCPWDDPRREIEMIEELRLSDDSKEKIFCGNAKRLLSI